MEEIPGPWPDRGAFTESTVEANQLRKLIRRKDFEDSEEFLLRVIHEPRNQMEVYWAVLALRRVGTLASVDALKQLCSHKKVDIAACSMLTIASIAGQRETEFYMDALTGKWYRQRWAALWAIEATADPKALPAVLSWVKEKRSAFRRGDGDWLEVALYLYRILPDCPEAEAALDRLALDTVGLTRGPTSQGRKGYDKFWAAMDQRWTKFAPNPQ